MAGLLAGLAFAAHADEAWVTYGATPDGGTHRWNKATISPMPGDATFLVTSRSLFSPPQPLPGLRSTEAVVAMADTRYLVNCAGNKLNATDARYYDSASKLVGSIVEAGPVQYIDPKGNRVRDRLFISVCTGMKAYQPFKQDKREFR